MKKTKPRLYAALVCNIAVVIFCTIGNVIAFSHDSLNSFQFYTVDSNLLTQIACAITSVLLARQLINGKELPKWAEYFKYAAVCCTTVTFLVVVFVLCPMAGGTLQMYGMMLFSGSMLYHHFLCPLIALISFIFFEPGVRLPFRACFIALIPTVLYASAAIILNLLRVIEGPYPFLRVYEQPWWSSVIWGFVILGTALAVASAIRALHNRAVKRIV